MKTVDSKQIKRNVSLTVAVQIVSFFVSMIINLLLPKFIDEEQYSYWQTFLLYASYVPLLHLGLLDGIVLRYSQYDYNELDKPLIRSQFTLFLVMEMLFAVVLVVFAFCFMNGNSRLIVVFLGVALVLINVFTYTSYTFQLTNRISKYAKLVLVERLVMGIGVILLVIANAKYFNQVCYVYFTALFIAIVWGYFNNNDLYLGKINSLNKAANEFKENLFSGFFLLLANLSSMLIIGGAKMVVQWLYDTLVFGQIAFAFSVSNLFLTFVTAASVALFPSIKRISSERLPDFYDKIRKSISFILFGALVLYFPCFKILQLWLPNYANSLVYLGVLMPIIIFSSKVTLLTNNYLKAYRKEKIMLKINIASVLSAFSLYILCAYGLNNLVLLLFCLDVVVMLRSIISEIAVMKIIKKNFIKDFVVELLMVVAFIICVTMFSLWVGFAGYMLILVFYLIKNKDICTLLKFSWSK